VNTISIYPPYKSVKPYGFYVYVHSCADTGREFYVGKGKGKRAWDRTKSEWRSKHWINTAAKHGVVVDVLQDKMEEDAALLLEMWVIAKIKASGGHLVNMTDGGDGTSGRVVGTKMRDYMSEVQGKKIHCSNGMTFNSHNRAARWLSEHLGRSISGPALGKAASGKSHMAYGFAWWRGCDQPKNLQEQLDKIRYSKGRPISTSCGLRFRTIGDALKFLHQNGRPKAQLANIWACAKGRGNAAYGYVWAYDDAERTALVEAKRAAMKPHGKAIMVSNSLGETFPSANQAAISSRERGYPTADSKSILRAAKVGTERFGATWEIHKLEMKDGH
jgi:hypothetical protein